MTTVTQTVQSYTGGISEQPDQLKVPGQVKSIQNALPDIVHGLHKRPGSARVGTTKLANVQSGGSWFHYYRDETEGSYIGQVAADGKIRMWCTKDLYNSGGTKVNSAGDEIFVHYDTVSGAYTQSNYSSSNTNHTSITSYLTPNPSTDTEDIQALTINDSTFLNNRYKTVTLHETTTAKPHTHCAYIDLLRTENGRQYALNIYSSDTTTPIKIATRIKVESDTLKEINGSGHCAGIGTQVFSGAETNSTGKTNLTFRLQILGQQGQGRDRTNNNTAEDFCCSYSRNLTLLHGGKGWDTNDTVTVTLDQANGGDGTYANQFNVKAQYTIKVTDHEVVDVKGTINGGVNGIIRPAPTPFDSDTSITPDAILGGITAELSGTGLTATVIGTGLYLSGSSAFNVEVVDQDLMRVMQDEVNDVTKLPIQCKHGYIVKVANTRMSDEDDYYVRFEGENGRDGTGSWVECAAPGIDKRLNATSMPHILQRQTISGTNPVIFLVKKFLTLDGDGNPTAGWADREVGDDTTNQKPSFVGKQINKVLFFRNRLTFLSGENVICARAGTLGKPNFWSNTALTVSAIDPVDISCASLYPSDLFDGVEVTTGLLCFSSNQQFLLSSDDTVFNPDTAKLRAVSQYNYNTVVPPISLGKTIGFIDTSNKYSRFMEMANIAREGEPLVGNSAEIVPKLIQPDIDLVTNSRENNLVFFGKTNDDTVIGYKYLRTGEEQIQSAWFKWKFNNPIKYHFIVNDEYFILDTDNFLQKINLVQSSSDISIDQDSVNYLLHLDNYTTVSGGVYNATTKLTTFTNQATWIPDVTTPNGKLVLVDTDSATARVGRYTECTLTGNNPNDDFTVPGDWSREVSSITVTNGGSGYSSAPTVTISGGSGTGATATATVEGGAVTAVTINNNGYNFTSVPTVSFSGGGGSSAAATAAIHTGEFNIGYLYEYNVEFPRFYMQKSEGKVTQSDVNSKLTIHRMKLNFGKIGLYETTLTRVGKSDYTEVYESTDLDEYDASDAPFLAEKIKDIPVYERNVNVNVILKSSHPAPATLRAMSWEGDWSPMHYRRV